MEDFEFDVHDLEPELVSAAMAERVRAVAEEVMTYAQSEAHRVLSNKATVYPDAFELRASTEKANDVNRATVWVVNTDPNAWAVEWAEGFYLMGRVASYMDAGGGE